MNLHIEEKRFGDKLIFSNESFSIPELSRTAILGPSGSGKTTLMRILAGLDKDYIGHLDNPPKLPVILFQEDRLSERITVLSNLMAVTDDKQKALAILASLSLAGEERSHIKELSGGMRRRVAIARMLLLDADIVFLDEPFRGLDDTTRRDVAKLILSYAEGKTLVFITHDEAELSLLASDNIIRI